VSRWHLLRPKACKREETVTYEGWRRTYAAEQVLLEVELDVGILLDHTKYFEGLCCDLHSLLERAFMRGYSRWNMAYFRTAVVACRSRCQLLQKEGPVAVIPPKTTMLCAAMIKALCVVPVDRDLGGNLNAASMPRTPPTLSWGLLRDRRGKPVRINVHAGPSCGGEVTGGEGCLTSQSCCGHSTDFKVTLTCSTEYTCCL
jgi:hypothetical protein